MASANGERQIFPKQTNRTLIMLINQLLSKIGFSKKMTVLKLPILEVNAQDYHQFNSFFYFALKAILLLWKK
ncbi:hypothetical protein [Algoriphagus boritolerans]|uniref:hypothetical protein n=1 Tax=Algoriphagus boritolerans TaxID=308111 RepID=UPI002FCE4FCA